MGGISSFSSIGSLSLVHPYTHLELPEIKSVDDYLVSLANPARDLAAMKVIKCNVPYASLLLFEPNGISCCVLMC